MTMMEWVQRLPEIGEAIIAKAQRVDALRREARELEAEVMGQVNARWSANEIYKAKG